jgi:RecJ-like exonuclease
MSAYEKGFEDCKKQVKVAMVAAVENAILMEREACARLVEEMASRTEDIRRAVLEVAAEGIRARWQK